MQVLSKKYSKKELHQSGATPILFSSLSLLIMLRNDERHRSQLQDKP